MFAKANGERLTLKERLLAFNTLPDFCRLVLHASPLVTMINLILRIVKSLMPLSILYVSKLIIDQVIIYATGGNNHISTQVWPLIILSFGLNVLSDVLNRLISFTDTLLSDRFTNYTSIRIMTHAATLDLEQFEDPSFYNKLERARQQTIGRSILLSQLLSQIQGWITMAFLSVGLIVFNPWLILVLLFSVLPAFWGEYYFNGKHYLLIQSQTEGKRELDYLRFVGASIETVKEIKLLDLSAFFIDRFRKLSDKFYLDNRRLALKQAIGGTGLALFGALGYFIAFAMIVRSVQSGVASIGDLTFLIGSFQQMKSVLSEQTANFSSISQGVIHLKDFFSFFHIKPKISSSPNSIPFPDPVKRGFTFENVGFKYENSERWANRHLNFTIGVGEKLALVGENGAGKTTLVKLLTRLYDPSEGRILLDGIDLKEYNLTELRKKIGIIFQDFYHYQMTSSKNVAVGNIEEAENHALIKDSAHKSLADQVIEGLPNKYEQVLGKYFNQGVELSGGEWQKIALARTYMRDAQLIILDEPTAALDAKSEYKVFQHFSNLGQNKSAVLISHRFSTVRMVDRILVLQNGEIVEMGSHRELLELGGRYAELFELQAMGYK
ncbi:MAG: ABC transporter ATP-binding protein [Williamsia sp.]|nr:ABC transporter ATP-binding protein [Williamsia sp.]